MGTCLERPYNGLIKENSVLALMLGMCPAVARIRPAVCVGRGLCVKRCEYVAAALESNPARIDPDKRAEKVIASAAVPAVVSAL